MLTSFVTHTKEDTKEKRLIREEIALTQRYMDGISPKLQKFKDLQQKKKLLQDKLKKM